MRIAQPHDLDAIMAIEQRAHVSPWSRPTMARYVEDGKACVIKHENRLCGYRVVRVLGDEAELLNIAITPEAQGLGLGKTLMTDMIETLEQRGARAVFLECRKSNHNAIHLYEGLGFAQIGERLNYYPNPNDAQGGREDALLYAMELGF